MRQLIETRTGACGCPEEVWLVDGIDVTIHFEDNHADAFADGGDWDVENRHRGPIDKAREDALAFVETWKHEARKHEV